jgi:hypothetical protein
VYGIVAWYSMGRFVTFWAVKFLKKELWNLITASNSEIKVSFNIVQILQVFSTRKYKKLNDTKNDSSCKHLLYFVLNIFHINEIPTHIS